MKYKTEHMPYTKRKNDMRTSLCSGLACDPFGKVIFSPFIQNDNGASLAAWSLNSGKMLTSLDIFQGRGTKQQFKYFIELKPTITAAYKWNDEFLENNRVSSNIPNCFGLWFKSNYTPGNQGSNVFLNCGGIHHITMRGSIDYNDTGIGCERGEDKFGEVSDNLNDDIDRLRELHNLGLLSG